MIPDSVQKQAEESLRLQQALIDRQRPPQQPETAKATADEAHDETQQNEADHGNPDEPSASGTQTEHEDDKHRDPGEKPASSADDGVDWKERFNNYKRGTDQTIYQLRHDLSKAIEHVRTLTQQVEQQTQQQTQQQQAKTTNADTGDSELTAEELEDLGDLGPTIEKVARRMAGQMVDSALQERLGPVQKEVGELRTEQKLSKEDQFWKALHTNIENLNEKNADPAFAAWLGQVDDISGVTRQRLLEVAQQNLDAHRVIAIFNAWGREQPALEPAPSPTRPTQNRPSPERKLQPDNRRTSAPTPDPQGRNWKESEIQKFYQELAVNPQSLRSRYTEEQIRAMDIDIVAAGKEGRIQRG